MMLMPETEYSEVTQYDRSEKKREKEMDSLASTGQSIKFGRLLIHILRMSLGTQRNRK